MNEHIRVSRPVLQPIAHTPPDDEIIAEHLNDPEGWKRVEAAARGRFHQNNPQAAGAGPKLAVRRRQIDVAKHRCERLVKESERTPLFDKPFIGDREQPLTAHDMLKYLLFQVASLAGIALAVHVLASYIANSDIIPDLSGNYPRSLLFAAVPVALALALKACAMLPEFEESRPRYLRLLRGFGILGGLSFVVSAAFAFVPHIVDAAALSDALASGSDPDGLVIRTIKTVSPYVLTLTHLFAEIALAPLLALAADAMHASGREVVERFSTRGAKLLEEIERLNLELLKLNEEAAVAARDAEMLAAAEMEAVRRASARWAELKAGLDQHLMEARRRFKSNLGSVA